MTTPIYLDYNATTPTDSRVVSAMLPFFERYFGNPAATTHRFGWKAASVVDEARDRIAGLIGAESHEIVFTSGATEANNLIFNAVAAETPRAHVVTTTIEHESVLQACRFLERSGFEVTYLPVRPDGIVSLADLEAVLRPETALISVMAANNEIGTLQPIAEIGAAARSRAIPFHTDATQSVGKIPVDVTDWNADYLTFSGHKLYGPKGIGAVYAKDDTILRGHPLIRGGNQERGIRSGTLNTPGIVGLAEACDICAAEQEEESLRLTGLRKVLWSRLKAEIEGIELNGHPERRLPGDLNFFVPGVDSVDLLRATSARLAMSTGSACTSELQRQSHVLTAIGRSQAQIQSSIRLSLGRPTSSTDVMSTADFLIDVIRRFRVG